VVVGTSAAAHHNVAGIVAFAEALAGPMPIAAETVRISALLTASSPGSSPPSRTAETVAPADKVAGSARARRGIERVVAVLLDEAASRRLRGVRRGRWIRPTCSPRWVSSGGGRQTLRLTARAHDDGWRRRARDRCDQRSCRHAA
jgi:hypothetical protein